MDKYAVVQDQGDGKTASKRDTCPECGQELEKNASVKKCPTHGTKPFEPKETPDAKSQDQAKA